MSWKRWGAALDRLPAKAGLPVGIGLGALAGALLLLAPAAVWVPAFLVLFTAAGVLAWSGEPVEALPVRPPRVEPSPVTPGDEGEVKGAEIATPIIRVRSLDRSSLPIRLGIRSLAGWGSDMEERNDAVLDLVEFFDGRHHRSPKLWWEKVFPQLREFLNRYVDSGRTLVLDFAAHSSIVFAAGWFLEAKSGLDVRVRQRTQAQGEREWYPNEGEVPAGPMWLDRPDLALALEASDLAAALAVTHENVVQEVQEVVRREGLPIRRIIDAAIAPAPGQQAIVSGAHMLHLAEDLLPRLRQRAPQERNGRLHLFYAGPNAFLFYLGQLARSLGRIVLYEYDFAQGRYTPSIELPPPPSLL